MSEHRIEQQPAFVLHQRPYRETSQLLELLTRDHGRVGAVARGTRRASSRLRGILQPFQPLLVSWTGRGELVTLTAAEPAGRLAMLRGDALWSGFYVSELALRLVARHDPHPGAFDAYAVVVNALAGGEPAEAALRLYEKRLLEALGYGLNLSAEAGTGRPVVPDAWYRVDPESGPVATAADAGGSRDVPGSTLIALAEERLESESDLRHAKRLLRQVLSGYLGPRPLRSREFRRGLGRR